ncbi:hypothetical protein [Auritidibacter ignavus]|uniref:hypothetical protein n=1 Tax=Auritidibacter ignavus TaxID=678932 RepID=UPI00109D5E4B|nr:hypothetical protein [Auritidibacter ignavus]
MSLHPENHRVHFQKHQNVDRQGLPAGNLAVAVADVVPVVEAVATVLSQKVGPDLDLVRDPAGQDYFATT